VPGERITVGRLGEEYAVGFLTRKGYVILQRNYRTPQGEIDLIALKEKTLVFIEVKTRSSLHFGEGFEAVNTAKQQRMRLLASLYLQRHNHHHSSVRFDVISLQVSEQGKVTQVKHFVEAF